ncbi:MAG: flagellar protein [Sporomusaceae bacterium]|jgi:flagellar operon protein|nr:flagellar protein [Sporomusaceae bacterium]
MADNRIYQPYLNQLPPVSSNQPVQPRSPYAQGGAFKTILETETTKLKFSKHALERLQDRDIQLDETQLAKLYQAVDKAAKKGARDSLILFRENLALVVSVKNRTVITAMDGESLKENVFTNIDSAVII